MFDKERLPGDAREYFDHLPKFLQESIMQAGVQFHSREEMQQFCEFVQE